jgi:hypothetical protein
MLQGRGFLSVQPYPNCLTSLTQIFQKSYFVAHHKLSEFLVFWLYCTSMLARAVGAKAASPCSSDCPKIIQIFWAPAP